MEEYPVIVFINGWTPLRRLSKKFITNFNNYGTFQSILKMIYLKVYLHLTSYPIAVGVQAFLFNGKLKYLLVKFLFGVLRKINGFY
jgi:hypothetical protein